MNITNMFNDIVEKYPEQICIIEKQRKTSYFELNEDINKLTNMLYGLLESSEIDGVIAVHMSKSKAYICTILAILRLGCAFLPIDKNLPKLRKKYLLNNSKARIVISDESFDFDIDTRTVVYDEAEFTSKSYRKNMKNCDRNFNGEQIAYIIYTSGTSGEPKGVMINHNNIVNINRTWSEDFKVGIFDSTILFANISFDASIWEIFMMILNGGTIHILDDDVLKSIRILEKYIKDNKISIMTFPPIYLENIEIETLRKLKYVFSAGSSIRPELYNRLIRNDINVINAYGPTEATICASIWRNCEKREIMDNVPIGYPIKGYKIYVINNDEKEAKINEIGELCISGFGLSEGYLYRKELTDEKFRFVESLGEKIYKTGDLGCINEKGLIFFHGRIDRQVKIRGYRVELDEIEYKLKKFRFIKNAAVVYLNKKIYAFVELTYEVQTNELKDRLKKVLPEYMLPNIWIKVKQIPININGKHDVNKLKEIIYNSQLEENIPINNFISQRGVEDNKILLLREIFEKIFNIKNDRKNLDFFELGGDSIHAIQIVAKLYDNGYELKVKDILNNPRIEFMAEKIKPLNKKYLEENIDGEFPLLPIQKWFLSGKIKNINQWNQAICLEAEAFVPIDIIKKSCEIIIKYHDALRIKLKSNSKENCLFYGNDISNCYNLKEYKLDDVYNIDNMIMDIQKNMNIENGPLMKVGVSYTENKTIIFFAIHHFVMDGISLRFFSEDMAKAIYCLIHNKKVILPLKTNSYKNWSIFVDTVLLKDNIEKDIKYWEEKIPEFMMADSEIRNKICKKSAVKGHDEIKLVLNKEMTNELLVELPRYYNCSVQDIIIALINEAYRKVWEIEGIFFNLESHGRENDEYMGSNYRTLGWFTVQYPVYLSKCGSYDYEDLFHNVKTILNSVPNKGITFEAIKYSKQGYLFKKINEPIINFNYLGEVKAGKLNEVLSISEKYIGNIASNGFGNISDDDLNYFTVNMSAYTFNSKFYLSVGYDRNKILKEDVINVLDSFQKEIEQVVKCLVKYKSRNILKKQFSHSSLNSSEIEKILKKIR